MFQRRFELRLIVGLHRPVEPHQVNAEIVRRLGCKSIPQAVNQFASGRRLTDLRKSAQQQASVVRRKFLQPIGESLQLLGGLCRHFCGNRACAKQTEQDAIAELLFCLSEYLGSQVGLTLADRHKGQCRWQHDRLGVFLRGRYQDGTRRIEFLLGEQQIGLEDFPIDVFRGAFQRCLNWPPIARAGRLLNRLLEKQTAQRNERILIT